MTSYLCSLVLLLCSSLIGPSIGVAIASSTTEVAVHNVTRIPGLKFENLAVRANGQLLTTISAPVARIYQVAPFGLREPITVSNLPGVSTAAGIKELEPDVFYVAAGNFTLKTATSTPGTAQVFQVDMRTFHASPNGDIISPAKITSVAQVSKGMLLNGMTAPGEADTLLVADTFAGLVWRVNVKTGAVSVAIDDPTMKGPSAGSAGINGAKVWKGHFYYDNTGSEKLFKIPISQNGSPMGKAVEVTGQLTCDDFIIDSEGTAFVAGPANVITRVSTNGQKSIIAGTLNSNSSALVGPTAVAFGRLAVDSSDLYVTTNGGLNLNSEGATGVSRIAVGSLL